MAKQGGNALRIALTLELLKWSANNDAAFPLEVSLATLRDALFLIDNWAIPMAQRTLEVMDRAPSDQQAASLAKLLKRRDLSRFNARKLRRVEYGPVGALANVKVLTSAIETLEGAGIIRRVGTRVGGTIGRRSSDYEVNPKLLDASSP